MPHLETRLGSFQQRCRRAQQRAGRSRNHPGAAGGISLTSLASAGPPVGIRIRPGCPEDLNTVASAVFSEKMNPLGLSMDRFLVAEEASSGRLVGFGQLKEWPTLSAKQDLRGQIVRAAGLWPNWRGELVELSSLVVVPEWRGRGVGSALVSELVQRAEGKTLCLLTIGSSVPFYERLGFKEISQQMVPRPLQPEVVLGTVVARLAANDRLLCMAHSSAIEGGRLPGIKLHPDQL